MGKRMILLVVLVAAGVVGYYYFRHHQDEVRMASGEVTCDGCMTPEQHAKFLRETAGETADSQSERRAKTPVTDDTRTVNAATTAASSSTATIPTASATDTQTVAAAQPVLMAPGSYTSNTVTSDAPKSDTIAPNPTNGMVFAGKGTYQWYRQGNLTWRVDTTSGRSCIIYATMDEWRKQIVLSHGCGHAA